MATAVAQSAVGGPSRLMRRQTSVTSSTQHGTVAREKEQQQPRQLYRVLLPGRDEGEESSKVTKKGRAADVMHLAATRVDIVDVAMRDHTFVVAVNL